MACYLDASALAKLVVAEVETPALQKWVDAQDQLSCPAISHGRSSRKLSVELPLTG